MGKVGTVSKVGTFIAHIAHHTHRTYRTHLISGTLSPVLMNAATGVSLKRGLRRGVHQLSRARDWKTTVLLLAAVMTLTQLFIVFLLGVSGAGNVLTAQAGIHLEVLPTAQESDIQALYAELTAQPYVRDVTFITGREAYERQKAVDPDLIAFLEEYDLDNPFPDTFAVSLRSLDDYEEFAAFAQGDRWRAIVNPSFLSAPHNSEREVRSLLQVTGGMRTLSVVLIVASILILFFVVLEWVSRNAVRREQELLLEHLLGAPPLAVLLPFAFEMTILLAAATLIGAAVAGAFVALLPVFMPALALDVPFRLLQTELMPMLFTVFPLILLVEIIAMPLLALGGTALGVRARMPASFTLLS